MRRLDLVWYHYRRRMYIISANNNLLSLAQLMALFELAARLVLLGVKIGVPIAKALFFFRFWILDVYVDLLRHLRHHFHIIK